MPATQEDLLKRVLPHSIEAEQSVIGAMIMDKEAITVASEMICGAGRVLPPDGIAGRARGRAGAERTICTISPTVSTKDSTRNARKKEDRNAPKT